MPWDPDCYQKFQSERAEPFRDLAGLIKVREGLRVIDLGCGTGELTRQLADMLPGSDVVGVDNSPQMLQRSQAHARPGRIAGTASSRFCSPSTPTARLREA